MKAGWRTAPLAAVCQIKPPKAEARGLISANDLVSFVPMEVLGIDQKVLVPTQTRPLSEVAGSYTYFADGDVLLAKITPCFENGKLGIAANLVNGIGFGSSEYMVFRPDPSVDKEWLYYFLSQESFRMEGTERMTGAVGHKRVAKDFIEAYPIPIPPLPEQRRIVTLLDEAFDGIATAKANAEKNLQNARAIFESRLQAVFRQRGEEWKETKEPLSSLCELIVDCEHKTAPTQEEGIPSIRTPNIGKGNLLLEGVYRVSEATYTEWTRRAEPRAGDLIFAREAPAGNVGVVPPNLRVCLGQRTVLIRPSRSVFVPEFLALLLLCPSMQKTLLGHSRGATVQHVNMKDIRALNVGAIPSISLQAEIVENFGAVTEETQRLESIYQRKLSALDELKKSLLAQAFSGVL
ncbi:MAG: restriction endonuclease subunit S [Rhodoferax sp.]|uniref:restriction endonuclease subunit S n=1 Tax=Rhodoferax sp. TaxID=50421 RepID=UPI002733BBB3|nr:restriction endonuclease subunit S [Rhodoferax sp.]MDP3337632.1 restriction endonuclease subunit S [Rhodoferax sp.]